MASRSVEFWYEFASTYSYLAAARIEALAEAVDVRVEWRPFLLGPIFESQGWDDSPFNLYAAKGAYMWRDMERQCERYGLPFRRPLVFPRNGLHAARIALVAEAEGWCSDWTRLVYSAEFGEGRDIADREILASLLETLGQAPERALAAAGTATIKQGLRAQTEHALSLGIFGAPSFIVAGELYWGNDRLRQAIAQAVRG